MGFWLMVARRMGDSARIGFIRLMHSSPCSAALTLQPRRTSSAHSSLRFGAESSTTSTRTPDLATGFATGVDAAVDIAVICPDPREFPELCMVVDAMLDGDPPLSIGDCMIGQAAEEAVVDCASRMAEGVRMLVGVDSVSRFTVDCCGLVVMLRFG